MLQENPRTSVVVWTQRRHSSPSDGTYSESALIGKIDASIFCQSICPFSYHQGRLKCPMVQTNPKAEMWWWLQQCSDLLSFSVSDILFCLGDIPLHTHRIAMHSSSYQAPLLRSSSKIWTRHITFFLEWKYSNFSRMQYLHIVGCSARCRIGLKIPRSQTALDTSYMIANITTENKSNIY